MLAEVTVCHGVATGIYLGLIVGLGVVYRVDYVIKKTWFNSTIV